MIAFVIAFAVLARILHGLWARGTLPPFLQLRLPEYDPALDAHVEPKTTRRKMGNLWVTCILEIPVFLGILALFHGDPEGLLGAPESLVG